MGITLYHIWTLGDKIASDIEVLCGVAPIYEMASTIHFILTMDIPGIAGAMEGSINKQIKRRKQDLPAKQETVENAWQRGL